MRLNRLQEEIEAMLECRKRALDEKWPDPVMLPVPDPDETVADEEYAFVDD